MKIKTTTNKDELGSIINTIKEDPKLNEKEKNEKMAEILIFVAHQAGRVNRSFIDRRPWRLSGDHSRLSAVRRLADHLSEEEKVKVLKEVVNAYMNVVTTYHWEDSYIWIKDAVETASKIPGKEGDETLEKLEKEFLKRNWIYGIYRVVKAWKEKGEIGKANELWRKLEFRYAALCLDNKDIGPRPFSDWSPYVD